MPVNARHTRVWKRLAQAYGSRLAESYGATAPPAWQEAIDDLSDEQITYGLRVVIRDSIIHPPTLGQFTKACMDFPVTQPTKGPTIQEQLCAYASILLHSRLKPYQFSGPWTYLYREWIDTERPKHLQRCAECVGVVIPDDEDSPGHRIMVIDMLADTEGHQRALRSFLPGPFPRKIELPDLTA